MRKTKYIIKRFSTNPVSSQAADRYLNMMRRKGGLKGGTIGGLLGGSIAGGAIASAGGDPGSVAGGAAFGAIPTSGIGKAIGKGVADIKARSTIAKHGVKSLIGVLGKKK